MKRFQTACRTLAVLLAYAAPSSAAGFLAAPWAAAFSGMPSWMHIETPAWQAGMMPIQARLEQEGYGVPGADGVVPDGRKNFLALSAEERWGKVSWELHLHVMETDARIVQLVSDISNKPGKRRAAAEELIQIKATNQVFARDIPSYGLIDEGVMEAERHFSTNNNRKLAVSLATARELAGHQRWDFNIRPDEIMGLAEELPLTFGGMAYGFDLRERANMIERNRHQARKSAGEDVRPWTLPASAIRAPVYFDGH